MSVTPNKYKVGNLQFKSAVCICMLCSLMVYGICCLSNNCLFLYSQSRGVHCYYDWRYLTLEEKKCIYHKRETSLASASRVFCSLFLLMESSRKLLSQRSRINTSFMYCFFRTLCH